MARGLRHKNAGVQPCRALRRARASGRKGGRPKKLKAADVKAIKTLVKAGELTFEQIAERFSVHRSAIYAALDE